MSEEQKGELTFRLRGTSDDGDGQGIDRKGAEEEGDESDFVEHVDRTS